MGSKRYAQLAIVILAVLLLIACAPEPHGDSATAAPETQTIISQAASVTPVPSLVPTASPSAVPPATVMSDAHACSASNIAYEIEATLDWPGQSLAVEQTLTFLNDTGHSLDTLVLAFPGTVAPEELTLKRIALGDSALRDYILNGQQLVLPLPSPLPPAEVVQVKLRFDLSIPPIRSGYRHGHLGYWGYSARQTNLGLWFPQLLPYKEGNGWTWHQFWPVGETNVSRAASYRVTLRVQGAPDTLRVAGPGAFVRSSADTWRFELCGSRELSLSISDQFSLLTTTSSGSIPVELFLLSSGDEGAMRAARHALQVATDALDLFEKRFGPFPFDRLVVVEGDFPDGMEFSGLVFVSEAWFRTWQGVPNDWLTLITAHEVAHQWWYAAVGNDQAAAPYLDEALATYSELLFIEHYHPELVEWWWAFRVNAHTPSGQVDLPVTAFDAPRPYINTVYLQGARMLGDLRLAMGDEAFFAWLAHYAETMRGEIAEPADFWGAMSADAYALTAPIRQRYLAEASVVSLPDAIP